MSHSDVQIIDGAHDRRIGPGIRLQVIELHQNIIAARIVDQHIGDDAPDVIGVFALIGPGGSLAFFLDLLAQGQHIGPGFRVGVTSLCKSWLGVPDARNRVGDIEAQLLAIIHDAVLRTREQGIAELLSGGVQGGGVHQGGHIHQLVVVHQVGHLDHIGARVVDHIRRIASHEARLQLLRNFLDALDTDRGPGVEFLLQGGGVFDVVVAKTTREEDAIHRGSRQAEGIDGGGIDGEGQIQFSGGSRGNRGGRG